MSYLLNNPKTNANWFEQTEGCQILLRWFCLIVVDCMYWNWGKLYVLCTGELYVLCTGELYVLCTGELYVLCVQDLENIKLSFNENQTFLSW